MGFDRLQSLLKSDLVSQQEAKLRLKKALAKATYYLPEFREQLETAKQNCLNLQ